jgi:hypothetical protein
MIKIVEELPMSNLWQCLEVLADGNYVAAQWAKLSGKHFAPLRSTFLRDTQKRSRFIPCPHGCGCEHEIVEHAGGRLVGVCQCEPWNCEDFSVSTTDATLLTFNTAKLGRALCRAFECDANETKLRPPRTWQIGTKFPNSVPVLLTIQNERASFRLVVSELSARLRQQFILLAPTSRLMDTVSREILEASKVGFFDLESNINISAIGGLSAKLPPGKLFQAFAPDAHEPVAETVAAQIFALVEKLDADERLKNPSVLQVFRLYCGRGLTAQAVADKCGCVKATVLNRLKKIRKVTGKDPEELRTYSPFFNKVEEAITDSRAENIHRKALVHDIEEPEDE